MIKRLPSKALAVALIGALTVLFAPGCGPSGAVGDNQAIWNVFALHYGETPTFSHRTLVRTAPKDEKVPFAWWAWILVPGEKNKTGRTILIDTGFDDEVLEKKWRLERHTRVADLLGSIDIKPSQISDLVLTHLHWDHAGDTTPYENATIWLQRDELTWAKKIVSDTKPKSQGLRIGDVRNVESFDSRSKLKQIDGDHEVAPGVTVHRGGKHTHAIQWVEVRTGGKTGTVVLASDIAYLYENVEKLIGSRSTGDHKLDVNELKKMKRTASLPSLVIPGHDPLVATRFPAAGKDVYYIGVR